MLKKGIVFSLFIFTLFFPNISRAETATHLVISEVQTSGVGSGKSNDDFIELYNPTNQEINLDEFRLVKRTSSGSSDSNIKTFSTSDVIPAFGYYLWANTNYTTIAVTPDATSSYYISDNYGVALRYGGMDTGIIIDSVGWGITTNIFVEGGLPATNPASGGSLERKPGESDSLKGNGEDTDNNANDFSLRELSNPQNSSSPIEIPIGMSLPENELPIANCGADRSVIVGTQIGFDGSVSTDSDGTINSYSWEFGDGGSDSGQLVNYTYSEVGVYAAELIVTDNDGDSDSAFCQISVIEAPIYSENIFLNEIFPYPNSTYDWDGDGVADSSDEWIELVNVGDEIVDLENWVLDDIEDGGSSPYTIPIGALIDPDSYLVFYKSETGLTLNNTSDTVILKNPDGIIVDQYSYLSSVAEKSISRVDEDADEWEDDYTPSPETANNPPSNQYPIVNAGSNITNAKTGEAVNFNGSASYDNDGQIISYLWSFGNGATSSGVTTSYAYSVPGTYQVTLTIKDDDGATSSAGINVSVVQTTAENTIYQNQFSDQIKITEILPNPTGTDTEKEYIKIENVNSGDLNLRNWSLDDEEGGSKPFLIDYDLIIKAKSTLTFYSLDTKINLNNTGDQARLIDPNNKVVSLVEYKESAKENAPYCLANGVWEWKDRENQESGIMNQEGGEIGVVGANGNSPNKGNLEEIKENQTENKPSNSSSPTIQILANSVENKDTETSTNNPTISKEIVFDLGNVSAPNKTQTSKNNSEKLNTPNPEAPKNSLETPQPTIPKPYQKPLAAIPVMGFSFFAITQFILRPEDWQKILEKFNQNKKEESKKFEELFK